MIIVVLLPLLAAAEWIEITQNYRKENKPIRHDHTNRNIYNNHSIVDHQWSKGHVHRINDPKKRILTNERKIERNPFHEVMYSEKLEQTSQNKDTEINQGRNKYESSKDMAKINSKPRLDVIEKGKQSVERIIKNNQNSVEKESVVINGNIFKNETAPCPKVPTNLVNDINNGKKQNQTTAMETLIKFLKMVSQTIKQGTRRNFKSKIRYLEDLRDTLLANIETRIDSVFPDDTYQRRRRAAGIESRGHVEFPSSESALMSISFLTFAVFLIKLVLQVIHTYKAKTMMVTPAMVATVSRAVLKKSTHN